MKTLIILFLLIAAQTFTQWQPSHQDLLILLSEGHRPAKYLQMIMKFPAIVPDFVEGGRVCIEDLRAIN